MVISFSCHFQQQTQYIAIATCFCYTISRISESLPGRFSYDKGDSIWST